MIFHYIFLCLESKTFINIKVIIFEILHIALYSPTLSVTSFFDWSSSYPLTSETAKHPRSSEIFPPSTRSSHHCRSPNCIHRPWSPLQASLIFFLNSADTCVLMIEQPTDTVNLASHILFHLENNLIIITYFQHSKRSRESSLEWYF